MSASWEPVEILLILVGVIVLVYYLVYLPMQAASDAAKQGFGATDMWSTGPGASVFTGANQDYRGSNLDGYRGDLQEVFSNGAMEPPVYWPGGDMAAINAYGQIAIGNEPNGDVARVAATAAANAATTVANAVAASPSAATAHAVAQGFRRNAMGRQGFAAGKAGYWGFANKRRQGLIGSNVNDDSSLLLASVGAH